MKKSIIVFLCILIFAPTPGLSWVSFRLPNVIAGGSAGYFYLALDNVKKIYDSRWDRVYSVHANARIYRQFYASIQLARYRKESRNSNLSSPDAFWNEQFLNIGIRRYSGNPGPWHFYTGIGFTFISIEEKPGSTILNQNQDGKSEGSGFYFELGTHYSLFSNLGIFGEFEISSAGEGGTPGFIGYNIGGYSFFLGMEFNF